MVWFKNYWKKLIIFLFAIVVAGCGILQEITSGGGGNVLPDGSLDQTDIRNWDLSPCFEDSDSFETCFNLFWNNRDMIFGGAETITEVLLPAD